MGELNTRDTIVVLAQAPVRWVHPYHVHDGDARPVGEGIDEGLQDHGPVHNRRISLQEGRDGGLDRCLPAWGGRLHRLVLDEGLLGSPTARDGKPRQAAGSIGIGDLPGERNADHLTGLHGLDQDDRVRGRLTCRSHRAHKQCGKENAPCSNSKRY
jgi:hypothetical protein